MAGIEIEKCPAEPSEVFSHLGRHWVPRDEYNKLRSQCDRQRMALQEIVDSPGPWPHELNDLQQKFHYASTQLRALAEPAYQQLEASVGPDSTLEKMAPHALVHRIRQLEAFARQVYETATQR